MVTRRRWVKIASDLNRKAGRAEDMNDARQYVVVISLKPGLIGSQLLKVRRNACMVYEDLKEFDTLVRELGIEGVSEDESIADMEDDRQRSGMRVLLDILTVLRSVEKSTRIPPWKWMRRIRRGRHILKVPSFTTTG